LADRALKATGDSARAGVGVSVSGVCGAAAAEWETIRFHIQLAVPADAKLGSLTLSWRAVEPASSEATTTVAIVG
jgi:hypothetical protein